MAEDKTLLPEATIKRYLIVQTEGSRQTKRQVNHIRELDCWRGLSGLFQADHDKYHLRIFSETGELRNSLFRNYPATH